MENKTRYFPPFILNDIFSLITPSQSLITPKVCDYRRSCLLNWIYYSFLFFKSF